MIHTVAPIHYDSEPNTAFQEALRGRVTAYLKAQPNGRRANGFMVFKIVFFLVAYWFTWAQLALVDHSVPVALALLGVLACVVVAVAYNISHDAVHGAISRKPWVNELLLHLTFNPLGPNAYLWRLRHAVMHHSAVNIPGYDFNIEASDILRFAPTQKWRPIHRYQHLYAPFAYMAFTLHWVFVKDFKMLGLKEIGNIRDIEHPWWRVLEVTAWKVVYVLLMLVIPTLATSWAWWQVLLGFLLYQAFVSFQFVITFVGSHLNEGMVFVERDAGDHVPHSFLEHALHTSMDFNPRNPLVSFWFGGFNAHVAHHMFPSVCSVHYPALTKIIQETAAEHGMPYKQMPIHVLFLRHFRYLKQLGADPESPWATYMHRPTPTAAG